LNKIYVKILVMDKKVVYSGIRASGRLHLGNYFGALKGMLSLQEKGEYNCIFSVVDLHAVTTPYNPKTLSENVREVILDYLAAGLDPEKCMLEIQSKVYQHTELAYLLSTIYPVSRLEDLPTYKEKKAQYPQYVNMGLLFYPVLMTADILLYKAELVPVGIDQEPHLEVAREIARKFNSMFGDTFKEPQRFKTEGEYIPSLTGKGKMSKSVEGGYINLIDDLRIIKEKIAKIPTDEGFGTIKKFQEGPLSHEKLRGYEEAFGSKARGVATLFYLVELFQGEERKKELEKQYLSPSGVRYQQIKDELSEAIYKYFETFRKKREEFLENPERVDSIIKESLKKCQVLASETMQEVKDKMGF
jgi:tryptophanyl-tRNA synthetase